MDKTIFSYTTENMHNENTVIMFDSAKSKNARVRQKSQQGE